jgi:hypothetical protein
VEQACLCGCVVRGSVVRLRGESMCPRASVLAHMSENVC